jgi:hypothetical protein
VPNTLFSTYSQGENRVTASILAVFERISFALVEKILMALCEEANANLLVFRNQPTGISSVPDAVIRASFAYWIETKIVPNTIRKNQLQAHLKFLDAQENISRQWLLVITPDAEEPPVIKEIGDRRLAWTNFDSLVDILTTIVTKDEEWFISDTVLPTEREQDLLRELVRFLISEKLIGIGEQAVVVPAVRALPEYHRFSTYICQPNRTFQPCTHLAFYADRKVYHRIPRILAQIENVVLSESAIFARDDISMEMKNKLIEIVSVLQNEENERYEQEAKIIFLTSHDDPETLKLTHDIDNDLTSDSGRTVAFVQGQRYVSLEKLKKNPTKTSQLLD